ncbi:30S ribosomal protein S5 [Candidatus Tremblaya phenacola]|uniref:30S ribosomal protein S5 n=1 Tax=Candidatus Tremblayella phenacoccinincola TaxID=1010676 RepID=UPI0010D1D8F8|nr:30S ribosomal protein S5 [Candidatus Tremblaya phenacola]KAH0998250.1 SSU ribosomal protein S5p [Candidatus Tremblaya phenacola]
MHKPLELVFERLITINRVTKVVKGGRIFSFTALVVVGDGCGNLGVGKGKSRETSLAVQKAVNNAKRNVIKVSMLEDTIAHKAVGKFGAATVILIPSIKGRGIIASNHVRSVFSVAGINHVVAKCHGSNNPFNVIPAVLDGLMSLNSLNYIFRKRGISPFKSQ